ncbi:CHAT domain-containing protein [Trichocoleus sp. FACHB-262]|uniref:CHAT domain-containing protein n=1 Tax=Trichocoleus sp. FACHB-262 TaxID=2692869 RepID=UPI0016854C17|nr:CHAT domain-containing protein [Trichocoleus sp. FACHB-262]MBD2124548.1 CHAT domain-containing protein [Trichocoleus sp. FACHB-262]
MKRLMYYWEQEMFSEKLIILTIILFVAQIVIVFAAIYLKIDSYKAYFVFGLLLICSLSLITLYGAYKELSKKTRKLEQTRKTNSDYEEYILSILSKLSQIKLQVSEVDSVEKLNLLKKDILNFQLFLHQDYSKVIENDEYDYLFSKNQLEKSIECATPRDVSESKFQFLLRYPSINCPDKAIIAQRVSLTIELLLDPPEDKLGLKAIQVQDMGTLELPEVEVVLSANGFDLEGSNIQVMQVERDADSQIRFNLIPSKLGEQKVKVDFWQHGRRIGTVRRNILVTEEPTYANVQQPDAPLLLELKTTLTIPIPPQDLDLLIDVADDGRTLLFRLTSSNPNVDYNHKRIGEVVLQGSPLDKMQRIYEELNSMANKVPTTLEDRELAERRLTAIGNQLWDELIPEPLKREYWRFKSRVKSFLITSEEPWIPWEMIKPYRYNDDGDVEQELFWCQQFALSRWLSTWGTADEMIIGRARSIAPTVTDLPSVKEELAFIERLSTLRAGITPLSTFGTRLQVLESFTNDKELSLLHFACHGTFDATFPNDSAIKLADGELRPSDIQVQFIGQRPRPLVFINACHGARSEYSFTGLGGWATRLVNARVGAFIGAMWEVSDPLALQFTKSFYTQLLQENRSIAESFRLAREEVRKTAPYNSTWLAYSLYADPEGRVKIPLN